MASSAYSQSDLIGQILDAMRSAGCSPAKPGLIVFGAPQSGGVHRYQIDGDKSGSKNGWFVFYDDGIPAGAFGSWKLGITETWCAKREQALTEAERAQRAQQFAKAKAEREKTEAQVRAEARERAAKLWDESRETVDAKHPYLVKKQIPAIGIRQLGSQLIIPILDTKGVIHSLEFIGEDKKFLTSGAKKGHFFVLGSLANAETILLCEGYATGVSIHRASGLPVVVAFDSGNLAAVALVIRGLQPLAALVFCADDDRWNPDPLAFKVGERKAREAAQTVDGFVIVPSFEGLPTDSKPTDFNDLQCLGGMPRLKAQLTNALAECRPAFRLRLEYERKIETTDDFETLAYVLARQISASDAIPVPTKTHLLKLIAKKTNVPLADLRQQAASATAKKAGWESQIKHTDEGDVKLNLSNLVTILNNHPDWRGVLFYDEFSGDILKRQLPPFANARLTEWADIDSSKTRIWLEDHFDFNGALSTLLVDEAIAVVADLHSVHVVKEYLAPLIWDGKYRLKTWLLRYLGAEDNPVHRFVGQAWMAGAVKRIYEPGCQFDNVLVLEGRQGIRKSTALRTLGKTWHAESITDVGSKDSLMNLRGTWIVEFSELDALSRVENSRMKQHISSCEDLYRPSYGRRSIRVKRQNVFAASCNPEQYLKDETGARRFWPVVCGSIDIDALAEDVDQLWAEALHLYRQGEQTWATPEMTYITEAQEQRYQTDPWEEPIIEFAYGKTKLLVYEVLSELRVDLPKQSQADKNRVVKILGRLGYHCHLVKKNGKTIREYRHD